MQVQDIQQQDEYETNSDTERDDKVEFEVVSKTCMTRSGRAVRAFACRLDLCGQHCLMDMSVSIALTATIS